MARLVDLIIQNPDAGWDHLSIPSNPNITIEDMLKLIQHCSKIYKPETLSENRHLTIDYVLAHFDYPWDIYELSKHPNITIDMIKKYKLINWNYHAMVDNPNLTDEFANELEDIIRNKSFTGIGCGSLNCDVSKDYERLCECSEEYIPQIGNNPNLSLEFLINKYQDESEIIRDSFSSIMNHHDMTIEAMEKYNLSDILMNDDKIDFSENPNITIDIIKKYKNKDWWDWSLLIQNPKITADDILKNPQLPWGPNPPWWENPNVSVEQLINKGLRHKYKWTTVSCSPNTPIDFILSNLKIYWNSNCNWDDDGVSANPNLTPDIILKYPKLNWSYENISSNLMTFHPVVYLKYIKKYITEHSYAIQNISVIVCSYV